MKNWEKQSTVFNSQSAVHLFMEIEYPWTWDNKVKDSILYQLGNRENGALLNQWYCANISLKICGWGGIKFCCYANATSQQAHRCVSATVLMCNNDGRCAAWTRKTRRNNFKTGWGAKGNLQKKLEQALWTRVGIFPWLLASYQLHHGRKIMMNIPRPQNHPISCLQSPKAPGLFSFYIQPSLKKKKKNQTKTLLPCCFGRTVSQADWLACPI